jgi:hypothetical protein
MNFGMKKKAYEPGTTGELDIWSTELQNAMRISYQTQMSDIFIYGLFNDAVNSSDYIVLNIRW